MMNTRINFKKTLLTLAVITACQQVTAQTVEDDASVEVINVTGVRGSLAKSSEIKQEAKSLVDSISSEELGRFPDNNVADSLSHISGITVSRTRNGEAQYRCMEVSRSEEYRGQYWWCGKSKISPCIR